jgi:hypothetical protein
MTSVFVGPRVGTRSGLARADEEGNNTEAKSEIIRSNRKSPFK